MNIWKKIPDLSERHRALYDEGLSHTAIARVLGKEFGLPISRNACIGRAQRQLYPERTRWSLRNPRRVPPKIKPLPEPASVPIEAPEPKNLTLLQLKPTQCHWPVNNGGPFRYCGHPATNSRRPYCPAHAQAMIPPPRKRIMDEDERHRRSLAAKRRDAKGRAA